MSINRNRAKFNKAQDDREYRIMIIAEKYPMYWDEGLNFKHGLSSIRYRSYKTWKHSRKTQYK